jgi:hypothetical protein
MNNQCFIFFFSFLTLLSSIQLYGGSNDIIFGQSQGHKFNVWGIRSGHPQQIVLTQVFEKISSQITSELSQGLIREIRNKEIELGQFTEEQRQLKLSAQSEYEIRRSRVLKSKFLLSQESNQVVEHKLFEVLQYMSPESDYGLNSRNTLYLCRDSQDKIVSLSFPYPIVLADKDLIQIPKDWLSEGGTLNYRKIDAQDLDISRNGKQRVYKFEVSDDDPDRRADESILRNRIDEIDRQTRVAIQKKEKEIQELEEKFADQTKTRALQKLFLSELKRGKVFHVKLDHQKVDCSCEKGKVMVDKTSLQTELVSCYKCNGMGYFINEIELVVLWSSFLPSGIN